MDNWDLFASVGLVVLSLIYGIVTRSAVTRTAPGGSPRLAVLALMGSLIAIGSSIWFSPFFEPRWMQYVLLIGVPFAIGYIAHRLAPPGHAGPQTSAALPQQARPMPMIARRIALVVLAIATGGAWIFLGLEFAWVKTILLALTLGLAFLVVGDGTDRDEVEAGEGGDR